MTTQTCGRQNKNPVSLLKKTEAFRRRNAEWPYELWDYAEWEECVYEAYLELKS